MATLTLEQPRTYNHTLFVMVDVAYFASLILFTVSSYNWHYRLVFLASLVFLVVAIVRKTDFSLWLSLIVSSATSLYMVL